ncbi:MAG: family 1 glycosylhydrolase [Phycisphaeraceae bacterium]|nr:family 1 glycosylhydrolase [Phycisphaeraceae bacterium]
MPFPASFHWGACGSSVCMEGAAQIDGRKPSIWDTFALRPGAIADGTQPTTACDHYHRYAPDVALMRQVGLRAYRTAVAWPRVLPDGTGPVNAAGLDFYDRLVDALLAADIQPYLDLYHWDLPQALEDGGGWGNPDIVSWYADFAQIVVARLGDRVRHWYVLNEPQCFVPLGYLTGEHAPGRRGSLREALQITHTALLAVAHASRAVRAAAVKPVRVGLVSTGAIRIPATDSPADLAAARWAMFDDPRKPLWRCSWFLDPLILGRYPQALVQALGQDNPTIAPGDLETIRPASGPLIDMLGFNCYTADTVAAAPAGDYPAQALPHPPGHPRSDWNWPVTPAMMYWGPRFLHERYQLPLAITECGLSNLDWVALDGRVHDPQRIDFYQRYLSELGRACAQGVPVEAFFAYSLMDDWECDQGFTRRMGLIHVDFSTQARTLKDSAHWYRNLIQTHSRAL